MYENLILHSPRFVLFGVKLAHFVSRAKIYENLILKSPRFATFGAKLANFGGWSDTPACQLNPSSRSQWLASSRSPFICRAFTSSRSPTPAVLSAIVTRNWRVSRRGEQLFYLQIWDDVSASQTAPGMVGLTPKWFRLAPNGTNPGLFQIRFLCIWRPKVCQIDPKWDKSGAFSDQ